MDESVEDPVARAATWYVAAFGGLAAALLAGTQWTGIDWDRASSPALAVASIACAVGAASAVVILATRVISPSVTLGRLQRIEMRARRRAVRSHPSRTWHEVADKHYLLRQLVVQDFLDSPPATVAQQARVDAPGARDRAAKVLAEANRQRAGRSFAQLRVVTVFAVAIVLAAAVTWSLGTRPTKAEPTVKEPVAVTVSVANGVDLGHLVGPGCSARQLDAVAIGGTFGGSVVVALPPQQDCPAAVATIGPSTGTVVRAAR